MRVLYKNILYDISEEDYAKIMEVLKHTPYTNKLNTLMSKICKNFVDEIVARNLDADLSYEAGSSDEFGFWNNSVNRTDTNG